MPQKRAATVLPIPWPISSLLLLCFVLVMLSATTDVRSVSIEPKPASVRPGRTACLSVSIQSMPLRSMPSLAKNGMGRPAGMSPMVNAASMLANSDTTVMRMRATSVDGIFLVNRGNRTMTAMVPKPSNKAGMFTPRTRCSGNWAIMSTTMTGDFKPSNG